MRDIFSLILTGIIFSPASAMSQPQSYTLESYRALSDQAFQAADANSDGVLIGDEMDAYSNYKKARMDPAFGLDQAKTCFMKMVQNSPFNIQGGQQIESLMTHAEMHEVISEVFPMLDANGDNTVTLEEARQYQAKMTAECEAAKAQQQKAMEVPGMQEHLQMLKQLQQQQGQ